MKRTNRFHSGATLIELIIYLAILAIVVAAALPMLYASTENRLLQQTISIVEQNGTQILQNTALHIRQGERILSPLMGHSGSFVSLQTASGGLNPVIIGFSSGSIVIVEHDIRELISTPQVAVQDFVVTNTSTSASRQSLAISFKVTRTIRLQQPLSYDQVFEAVISLPPDDVPYVDPCGCIEPYCNGNDTVAWQLCEYDACVSASTDLKCP
jgi:hypothetical protein